MSNGSTRRIIACLDVTHGRVVKGVQFVDLIDAGDPAELARLHAESGADEIVLLDITATSDARPILIDVVRRTASQLFVPFTVGGGVRSLDDAARSLTPGPTRSASTRRPSSSRRSSPRSPSVLARRLWWWPLTPNGGPLL